MLKNNLYRFHNFLDRKEGLKMLIMFIGIGIPNMIIVFSKNTGSIYLAAFVFLLMTSITISRIRYINGKLKFNKSLYKIPSVGDDIVFNRDFFFIPVGEESFNPSPMVNIIVHKTFRRSFICKIPKGTKSKIVSIKEKDCNWDIQISFENMKDYEYNKSMIVQMDLLKTRKHWNTLSDNRDDRLKSIGI